MARVVVAYCESPPHDLLRAVAAQFHGVDPGRIAIGHDCPRCGSAEHGRPLLIPTSSMRSPAHVSVSRAGGLSLVAVSDAGPVGVDVEPAGAAEFAGFADVALDDLEREDPALDPTQAWVRKEALLKAHGLGLAVDPRTVPVREPDDTSSVPGRMTPWCRDLDVPGHVAAVAVLLERPADANGLAASVSRW